MRATPRQLLDTFDQALSEVRKELAAGELDGSGRFYSDEELAAGAATGRLSRKPQAKPEVKAEDSAA